MKTTPKTGKVLRPARRRRQRAHGHQPVVIDTKSIRAAGRSTLGVKLLSLDADDKVAAAVVIPPDESKSEPETGLLLQ
jgi:DNA gyrase subunit A